MDNEIFNNEIFNNEIFNTVSFNQMRKFKTELSRGVKDNSTFTDMICNGIIGILTPWANCEVRGTFYATGEALNKYIRKSKQVLGMWNYNCVILMMELTIVGILLIRELCLLIQQRLKLRMLLRHSVISVIIASTDNKGEI